MLKTATRLSGKVLCMPYASGVQGSERMSIAIVGAGAIGGHLGVKLAAAFGYGSEEFNERLDEHGFHLDVAAMRARLERNRRDADTVRVLNMLPPCDGVIAYYAPVFP